jgi:hypothetical protein
MDTTPQPTQSILLVYIGSRLDPKGDSLNDFWMSVTPEEFEAGKMPDEPQNRSYGGKISKKRMTGVPGTVYKVQETIGSENSSIFPDSSKYEGQWPDQEQRTLWQVEHRTAVTTLDLRKKAKKEGSEDNFAVLMPFRTKYRSLVSQDQRAALLAQMIAFVTAR